MISKASLLIIVPRTLYNMLNRKNSKCANAKLCLCAAKNAISNADTG
jgi:hypothetical protein